MGLMRENARGLLKGLLMVLALAGGIGYGITVWAPAREGDDKSILESPAGTGGSGAETAGGNAGTAGSGAKTAGGNAGTGGSGAKMARDNAGTAGSDAETARSNAGTGGSGSETARGRTAGSDAEAAESGEEAARSGAKAAGSGAEAVRSDAEMARSNAEADKSGAGTVGSNEETIGSSTKQQESKTAAPMTEPIVYEYTDYKRAVPRLVAGVEAQMERINQGEILADILELEELDHFYALIALNGIVARNQETGEETEGGGQVTVYVPNLIEGLEEVSVLFYGRESEQWEIIPADGADPHKKTVTMVLPGSGILTVIYKR